MIPFDRLKDTFWADGPGEPLSARTFAHAGRELGFRLPLELGELLGRRSRRALRRLPGERSDVVQQAPSGAPTWIALDYRLSAESSVTWFDVELESELPLAPTFRAFAEGLVPSGSFPEE
jgi:hypothetical protein